MCGIAGLLATTASGRLQAIVEGFTHALTHRGPDESGIWIDAARGIALGHRRLSILDLSPAGRQPMLSHSERYAVVFNGEIYNFGELRSRIEKESAVPWRGHSDTEVLLAAIDRWGVEKTLSLLNGMFAFAVWDRSAARLHLARDRLGEKPLYYGWIGKDFVFASELKSFHAHPEFKARIDRKALAMYMRYGNVPGEACIFEGLHKLQPATVLSIDTHNFAPGQAPVKHIYWSLLEVAAHGPMPNCSEGEMMTRLEQVLRDAIGRQMVADVPVGAFLSGGIDSSLIVSLMQELSASPVRTFSIGFHEDAYNEAEFAKQIAGHLGTEHTELYVTASDMLDVIPRLRSIYDEPFADSSQVPTVLVSALARQHVTVSLSGDAGDELFAGYNRYTWGASMMKLAKPLPAPLRKIISRGVTALPADQWDALLGAGGPLVPASLRASGGDKLHKAAAIFATPSLGDVHDSFVSLWRDRDIVHGALNEAMPAPHIGSASLVEKMMLLDLLTYLPNDILVKVDRAAMSVGLESRIPFLDREVVEFALRLPLNMKLRDGKTKWALRQMLAKRVPPSLLERNKMGFSVPLDHWLRGELKEWAADLLSEDRLKRDGFFEVRAIRKRWGEHQRGERNWQHSLWTALMFQDWLSGLSQQRAS